VACPQLRQLGDWMEGAIGTAETTIQARGAALEVWREGSRVEGVPREWVGMGWVRFHFGAQAGGSFFSVTWLRARKAQSSSCHALFVVFVLGYDPGA
jgi:hypothetical protein